jgi:hypothetical protein
MSTDNQGIAQPHHDSTQFVYVKENKLFTRGNVQQDGTVERRLSELIGTGEVQLIRLFG